MRFAHPLLFYLTPATVLVVGLGLAWARSRRTRLTRKFTGERADSWAGTGASKGRQRLDFILVLVTLAFLQITLARPMVFSRDEASELQGVPYLVALDVSRSMLAGDVKPSRFVAATRSLDQFFAETKADRVGLITFAGVAYLNAPLTFDMTALRTIMNYVQPEDIIDPGSSMSAAIERAARYFASNNIPQRVLVIVSDGEDLDGRPIEVARRLAREQRLRIATIGVGTSTGSRVPLNRAGFGAATNTFGQQVTTKLNEANLQRVANAAGGHYFRLGENGEGLQRLRREVLAPLAESAAREDLQNYREFYQVPLALALACLLGKLGLAAERFRERPRLPSIYTPPTN
jgi:Ca-activated chloride channel family protein